MRQLVRQQRDLIADLGARLASVQAQRNDARDALRRLWEAVVDLSEKRPEQRPDASDRLDALCAAISRQALDGVDTRSAAIAEPRDDRAPGELRGRIAEAMMKIELRRGPCIVSSLAWTLGLLAAWTARAAEPKPAVCAIQADPSVPIAKQPGRVVYCGLDLGSRTAKLSVVSMQKGRKTTTRDERQCKRTLGLGELVFDSTTSTARPLSSEAIETLADTIREYQRICALDGGSLTAVGATQWARDATNITDVQARVRARTGVGFEVLSGKQEADYGYLAASLDTPGRIVLDPGSNSFQLAWQERGSPTITSIVVRHGYVRGAVNEIEPAADYPAGRQAYQHPARRRARFAATPTSCA